MAEAVRERQHGQLHMPERSSRQRLPAFRIWGQVNLGSGIYWRAQRDSSVSTKVSGAPVTGNRNRGGVKVCAARLRSLCGAIGAIAWLGTMVAKAQDAEPRSYSNTPVGLNFLIAGALYSQGKLAFDPDLSVVDANFHSNTGLLAYVRSFDCRPVGQVRCDRAGVFLRRPGPCRRPATGARDGGHG